jgi:two-component system, chemotaxis family, chemotaxis protein CheY
MNEEQSPHPTTTGSEGPVLIVDDDLTIVDIVKETLEFENIPVITASNGREALECVEKVLPSVVLLDMRMPVMDGWQFASNARARGLKLSIVVMTAAHDAGKWAKEIGATDYLEKPFDLENLLAVVERSRRGPNGHGSL